MSVYSLELTIDAGDMAAKAFRAFKRFDNTVVMGTALQLMRERKPLSIHLDRPDRAEVLARLVKLLDELNQLGISHNISVNNVPRSSYLWNPSSWQHADVVSALAEAVAVREERRQAAERMKDYVPPETPPARKLLDQRWRDIEFSDLMASERNYIYIWAMRAEVYNGGFAAFFDNSTGDDVLETQSALTSIGSDDVRSILSDALQLLETAGGYSTDREVRWETTSQLAEDAFTELNERYYNTAEDVVGIAFRLVEADYESEGLL
ncbi:MAG: DUF4375 domain-containing protein [Planctomycetales bacterium]|nr:DUF4375 domain-containing protein [Planctomycetales bacterium]